MKRHFPAAVLLVLLCAGVLLLLRCGRQEEPENHGKTVEQMLAEQALTEPDPVLVQGVRYVPRESVSCYLFMGIDKEDGQQAQSVNFSGQADALVLLIADAETQEYTLLQLDRDTLCTVDVLGAGGDRIGTAEMQLCLAHAYGSGGADSCENTVSAVSRLLYDTLIDGYVACWMGGMSVLNDAVGGVTVTVEDDFSRVDPSLVQGETVALTGEQAYSFLRGRMAVGDGTNQSRMRRHRAFLTAFLQKLETLSQTDGDVFHQVYEAMEPYILYDIAGQDMAQLLTTAAGYTAGEICTLAGETRVEDGKTQFIADEDALQQTVLALFYEQVPSGTE